MSGFLMVITKRKLCFWRNGVIFGRGKDENRIFWDLLLWAPMGYNPCALSHRNPEPPPPLCIPFWTTQKNRTWTQQGRGLCKIPIFSPAALRLSEKFPQGENGTTGGGGIVAKMNTQGNILSYRWEGLFSYEKRRAWVFIVASTWRNCQ